MLRHWRNILRAAQTRPITSPPWFIIGIFSIIYLGSLWCCFCLGSYLSTEDYSTVHKVFILIHNEWLLLGSYLISNKYVFDLFILIFSLYIMNSIIHLCECCIYEYVPFIIFCVNVFFCKYVRVHLVYYSHSDPSFNLSFFSDPDPNLNQDQLINGRKAITD